MINKNSVRPAPRRDTSQSTFFPSIYINKLIPTTAAETAPKSPVILSPEAPEVELGLEAEMIVAVLWLSDIVEVIATTEAVESTVAVERGAVELEDSSSVEVELDDC
jgi:hypothetical protein